MKTYNERSEAVAQKLNKLKRQKRNRSGMIAGVCLCLVLVLVGSLFIPYNQNPPSVAEHARSPYYQVIQKINTLNYRPSPFRNAWEALTNSLYNELGSAGAVPEDMNGSAAVPNYGVTNGGDTYVEVTDNQVAGVTEADIFKRSDKYLYYLSGTDLRVYSIAAEASKEIGTYSLEGFNGQNEKEDQADYAYVNTSEMYLSADCSTITLVLGVYSKTAGTATVLLNLDVSDPANITEADSVWFRGDIISSRVAGEKLLLVYNYRVSRDVDFDKPETYVPSYGKPGDMTCLDAENIICPDTARDTRYTVVCQLDGKTLEVEDTKALMSYGQELYVSENAIYATHSFSKKDQVDANIYSNKTMTRITGIAYGGDKLQYQGSIDIEGTVKNQYAMDEYQDMLRVVTSTSYSSYEEKRGEYTTSVNMGVTRRNVSLYCINLKAWEVAALVGGFAPEGETAESVRFDGTMAYVCTAEVVTLMDPVYFFDLSDLEHITYTDTGTIDGYSSSLVQLGDGFLLGIGFGDNRQLKVEVYEQSQGKVISVAAWEENASFDSEYKAYFIDREENLLGLAVQPWDHSGEAQYLLLHFDGYKLNEVLRVDLSAFDQNATRACIIDGFLYILTYGGLTVEKVW